MTRFIEIPTFDLWTLIHFAADSTTETPYFCCQTGTRAGSPCGCCLGSLWLRCSGEKPRPGRWCWHEPQLQPTASGSGCRPSSGTRLGPSPHGRGTWVKQARRVRVCKENWPSKMTFWNWKVDCMVFNHLIFHQPSRFFWITSTTMPLSRSISSWSRAEYG